MVLYISILRDGEGHCHFQIPPPEGGGSDACKFEVTKRWGFGGVNVSFWVVQNWVKVKS
jgi:hypothetical protein